ncbi:MAG: hypothetical protein FJ266_03155 [Planctomycetes bacterium]|nr:hypothetical protein [Planctomycetota bacterium]
MKKPMPFVTKLEPGTYYWCTCAETKKQPFCDGSHEGTEHEPQIFTISEKNRWGSLFRLSENAIDPTDTYNIFLLQKTTRSVT